MTSCLHHPSADRVAELAGEQTGIHRRKTLAVSLENLPQPQAQLLHVFGRRRPRPGPGAHRDDVAGTYDAVEMLGEAGLELGDLRVAVAIGFIQHHQHRPARGGELFHGLALHGRQIGLDHEDQQIGSLRGLAGDALAFLAAHLVDARRIDEKDAAAALLLPAGIAGLAGLAMQRADREAILTEQGVEQRRLADADAAEHRDMYVPVLELVEHAAQIVIVPRQLLAHRGRYARVVEQTAQALTGQRQMGVAAIGLRLIGRRRSVSPPEPASPSGLSAPEDLHPGSPGISALLPQVATHHPRRAPRPDHDRERRRSARMRPHGSAPRQWYRLPGMPSARCRPPPAGSAGIARHSPGSAAAA